MVGKYVLYIHSKPACRDTESIIVTVKREFRRKHLYSISPEGQAQEQAVFKWPAVTRELLNGKHTRSTIPTYFTMLNEELHKPIFKLLS